MPIRPENRAKYPPDWPAISRRIRKERAGDRCERVVDGIRCEAVNGQPHPITTSRVVLTVAHLDHALTDHSDANLEAMCQRCHLRYDAAQHQASRRARRAVGADLPLFRA